MNDLFGDPLPPTPPMSAPLPWRVFRVSDCEWWLARSLDEARAHYREFTGEDIDEDARELTDAELCRLQFIDDPDRPLAKGRKRSFAKELALRISAGVDGPQMFACSEY